MAENYAAGESWVDLGTYAGPGRHRSLLRLPLQGRREVAGLVRAGELRGCRLRGSRDDGRAQGADRADRRGRRDALVHRARLGRRDRLARDRLGRGHDAAHAAAGSLRPVGHQRDPVQRPRGRRRDRGVRLVRCRTTSSPAAAARSPPPTSATAPRASSTARRNATCTVRLRSSRPSSPKAPRSGTDADFFYFPAYAEKDLGQPVLGAGTLFAITNDSPGAQALIEFLQTPIAHEVWMAIPGQGFLTPLTTANLDDLFGRHQAGASARS